MVTATPGLDIMRNRILSRERFSFHSRFVDLAGILRQVVRNVTDAANFLAVLRSYTVNWLHFDFIIYLF